jgi:hypothetical protein
MVVYTFGVFAKPLASELKTSRGSIALAVSILDIMAQFLIGRGGWHLGYLGLAGACMAVAVPVVWFFLRESLEEVGLLPDGQAPSAAASVQGGWVEGTTVREALRTRTFWQLGFIFFSVAACITGASAHLVPLLTDAGVSGQTAALCASLFGAALLVGRVGNGYLLDRFFGPYVAAVLFAGAEGDLMPFLVSRYFGMRAMAQLYGCMFAFVTLGNAAGRYLLAAGFDVWGSCQRPLAMVFLTLVVAVLASLGLGKYRDITARLVLSVP